jgi:uncharacterized heparinase superfamily protein
MQALSWRFRRLLGMSPQEVAWRAHGALRDLVDAQRAWRGRVPRNHPLGALALESPGFRVCDMAVGEWAALGPDDPAAGWRERLRHRAEAARAHRPTFFGQERDLGDPIDWNRDPETGRGVPRGPSLFLDYRDYAVAGDAKMVWEPNRHHHLVLLGRAFRATGDRRYAEALRAQLESWLDQCPYGRGLNWRSPLELAIRVINWVWALDLVRESGAVDAALAARVAQSAHLHLDAVARRYSRGSSANNHRIGEAAGVFIGSSYFRSFAEADRWRDQSRAILGEEIRAQTFADGGSREHALGYHLFVLEFFVIAAVVARRAGEPLPDAFLARLEKMLEFLGAFAEGGERLPLFGDCDEGQVLDLDGGGDKARALLAAGAVLFGRPDFKAWAGGYSEAARWLLGAGSRAAFAGLAAPRAGALASRALPASGYYLLQSGGRGRPDAISVAFDCAELGFGAIAAHGHADALSFTLRAFGRDVLVDPGTYDYFRHPAWRDYFRSTRAHNTVVVDGEDQSVMRGPFLWGERARARCLEWSPAAAGGVVAGEHDGYRRLADPVMHRRTLDLDGRARRLAVRDRLDASGRHRAALHFHFAEDCRVSPAGPHAFRVETGRGAVTLALDPRLSATLLRGSEDPIAGWVSRGYHRKSASATVIGEAEWRGPTTFECRLEIGAPVETS